MTTKKSQKKALKKDNSSKAVVKDGKQVVQVTVKNG